MREFSVAAVQEFVERHWGSDMTLAEIASHLGMSEFRLRTMMADMPGLKPRIEAHVAKALMSHPVRRDMWSNVDRLAAWIAGF